MEKNKILIFLILTILSYANAQQDLCGEALAQGSAFANDPADCTRYIYCERNSTNHLTRIGYGQCDQSSSFKFFKNGACTTDAILCAPGALCPVSGDYKVAVPSDSCTSYRFCKLTAMPPADCAEGLTFDRSSGNCIDNSDGFVGTCPIPPPPGAPTTTTTTEPVGVCIDIPDYTYMQYGDCQKWAFCVGNAVYMHGTCPCGYASSDNSVQECVVDETCNPCEAPTEGPTEAPGETPTDPPPTFDCSAAGGAGFWEDGACDKWVECDANNDVVNEGTCPCGEEFDGTVASAPACAPSTDNVNCNDASPCPFSFKIGRKHRSFLLF